MSAVRLAELNALMAKAAREEDFERAAALRDEIAALADSGSRLRRQVPGKMGLGTDQAAYTPPEGWVPPTRPDLRTAKVKPRRGGRK